MIAEYNKKSYELKGEKCILSSVGEKDIGKFVKWLTSRKINRYLSRDYSGLTLSQEKKWFKETRKSSSIMYFGIYALENKNKKLIGSTSLMKIDNDNKNAEFGIVIGDKSYWGKGIGAESARLISGFGFNVMGLNSIYLAVDEANKAGQKAYKRAGFKKAGLLREHAKRKNYFSSAIIMDMTKKDFKNGA